MSEKSGELPSTEVQRLWFATLKKEWSSLAVLPSHPGGSAAVVGRALAQVASLHKDSPIKLISAEGTDLSGASRLIIDMTSHVAQLFVIVLQVCCHQWFKRHPAFGTASRSGL